MSTYTTDKASPFTMAVMSSMRKLYAPTSLGSYLVHVDGGTGTQKLSPKVLTILAVSTGYYIQDLDLVVS